MNTYYATGMSAGAGAAGFDWAGVRKGEAYRNTMFSNNRGTVIEDPTPEQTMIIKALEATPEAVEGWYDRQHREVLCVNAKGFIRFSAKVSTPEDVDAILAS